jgi:hypothetical protein
MVSKNNIAFYAVVGALVVVLLGALVWMLGRTSEGGKLKKEVDKVWADLERLAKDNPTKEHLDKIKAQHDKANNEYAALNERLRTWWDKDVYDEKKSPREPVLFLGDLQSASTQIRWFAAKKRVELAPDVENLGFPDLLRNDKPPVVVTYEMLKERSAIKDILMLLIHDGVESIDAISRLEPAPGGKLYGKLLFSVSFTCKYPSLAKFQADLVNTAKVPVDPYGDFPRNYLVIERLSYLAEDRKVAYLEDAATAERAAATTDSRRTPTGTRRTPTDRGRIRSTDPGSFVPNSGRIRPPDGYDARGSMGARGHGTVRRPPSVGGGREGREQPRTTVGRMPNYNILSVTMTIAMVDFGEDVTGTIPALEEERKPSTASTAGATSSLGGE